MSESTTLNRDVTGDSGKQKIGLGPSELVPIAARNHSVHAASDAPPAHGPTGKDREKRALSGIS